MLGTTVSPQVKPSLSQSEETSTAYTEVHHRSRANFQRQPNSMEMDLNEDTLELRDGLLGNQLPPHYGNLDPVRVQRPTADGMNALKENIDHDGDVEMLDPPGTEDGDSPMPDAPNLGEPETDTKRIEMTVDPNIEASLMTFNNHKR